MNAQSVIIAGGAGYIGSHMTRLAQDSGYQAVVMDNLATGHADAVSGGACITRRPGSRCATRRWPWRCAPAVFWACGRR